MALPVATCIIILYAAGPLAPGPLQCHTHKSKRRRNHGAPGPSTFKFRLSIQVVKRKFSLKLGIAPDVARDLTQAASFSGKVLLSSPLDVLCARIRLGLQLARPSRSFTVQLTLTHQGPRRRIRPGPHQNDTISSVG